MITRALGVDEKVDIDRTATEFRPGDVVLLCSDGVFRTLSNEILSTPALSPFAQHLLDQPLSGDGKDNASLVLILAD